MVRSREVVVKEILRRVVGKVLVISVEKLCCLNEIEAAFVAYSARHQRLFYMFNFSSGLDRREMSLSITWVYISVVFTSAWPRSS